MGNIDDLYGGEFDAERDDAATGFEPIPAGWYPVTIESEEIKDTAAGTGKFLHLELDVEGDNYAGRKLWPNINLVNPNPTAQEIGERELAGLCQACGLKSLKDTEELVGHTVMARVKITKGNEKYPDPDNDVTAYKPMDGNVPERTEKKSERTSPPTTAKKTTKPADNKKARTAKRPWEKD